MMFWLQSLLLSVWVSATYRGVSVGFVYRILDEKRHTMTSKTILNRNRNLFKTKPKRHNRYSIGKGV